MAFKEASLYVSEPTVPPTGLYRACVRSSVVRPSDDDDYDGRSSQYGYEGDWVVWW